MATPFSEIYDLFLCQIQDYKIDNLYIKNQSAFETYLQGFLVNAIPGFDNCEQELTYDLNLKQFNATLTMQEKNILAKWMVIQWILKEIQNITQINNHLSDTDFKTHSNYQGLREKSEYYNRLREMVNQDMVIYGLKHTPWSDWAAGNFLDE